MSRTTCLCLAAALPLAWVLPGAQASDPMRFGSSVLALGDWDKDGVPDFAVGAPATSVKNKEGVGTVFVYSGKTGRRLAVWTPESGPSSGAMGYGRHLLGIPDANEDGVRDVLICSYRARLETRCAMTGSVISKADPAKVAAPTEEAALRAALRELGQPGPVDLDGDGLPDPVSYDADFGVQVIARSGATEKELWKRHWMDCGPHSGLAFTPLGDVDGDGVLDLLFGTAHRVTLGVPAPPAPGHVRLLSGATGKDIWMLDEKGTRDLQAFLNETAWNHRLLVIAGPKKEVEAQVQALAKDLAGVLDRDIVVVELSGPTAKNRMGDLKARPASAQVAEHYGLDPKTFQMALVGKDTGVKERYRAVTPAKTVWKVIDVMPMRRSEERDRREQP